MPSATHPGYAARHIEANPAVLDNQGLAALAGALGAAVLEVTDGAWGWVLDAACGADETLEVDAFFPPAGPSTVAEQALATCATCPVRRECAQHAIDLGVAKHGIHGGVPARALNKHGMSALD